jgi:hypothetical protein
MATEGGRIPLPLAVGVDCSHPRPLGVDHSHPQWPDLFFFFFLVGSPEANMATDGGRISPPSRWGGSRPPPMARSIYFFLFAWKVVGGVRWLAVGGGVSRRRWAPGGGRWRRPSPEVGGGLFIWLLNLLIRCFDFIFSWCIFLKLLRCQ